MFIAPGSANTNCLYLSPRFVLIRLFDSLRLPLPGANFVLTLGATTITGTADSEGYAQFECADCSEPCEIRWKPDTTSALALDEGYFDMVAYRRVIFLNADSERGERGLQQRLHNLGYDCAAPLDTCIRAFQRDYGLPVNGQPNDEATFTKIASVHESFSPVAATTLASYLSLGSDGGND